MKGALPGPGGEEALIVRGGEFAAKKPVQTNLVTPSLLVTASPLTTPSPRLFVLSILHRCIVSLSKMYKSFLLGSLLLVLVLL